MVRIWGWGSLEAHLFRVLIFILMSVFFACLHPVVAQERAGITVSGTELSGLLDSRRAGPYNEIFHLLTDTYSEPVFLNIAPMRRASRLFLQHSADCLFVGSDNPEYHARDGLDPSSILISLGIYEINIRVYSAKGSVPIESGEDLRYLPVGMDTGVGNLAYVADLLGRSADTMLPAQTLEQGFQMLDKGRIAGLVAIDTDVLFLQTQNPRYKEYPVSESFSVRTSNDVMVCHRMPRTESFMNHVNMMIGRLKDNGKITQVLTNSFLGNGSHGSAGQD